MPKLASIGSYGQNQALRAHVWAKNGPKTAEARAADWHHRHRIGIRTNNEDPRTYTGAYVPGDTYVSISAISMHSHRLALRRIDAYY
jgi:hypothetical protein